MLKKNFRLFVLAMAVSTTLITCKKEDAGNTGSGGSGGGGGGGGSALTAADYAGTWNVSLQCNTTVSFQMVITASGSSGVSISNFHKQTYPNGFTVTGTVGADGKLTIPSQSSTSPSQGGPYTFAGSGTKPTSTTLNIPYTIGSGASSISCTATCTKQ